jgi:hypothetical protein
MNLTRSFARIAATAVLTVGAALGVSNARAADDTSVGTALLGLVGVNTNNSGEKIDYRERAKVVVPPNRQELPAPRPAAESRPSSWPVDQENAHRSGARVANSAASNGDEPARQTLTEPPAGYRRPTQDLSKVKDTEVKSSGWSFDSIKKAVGLGQ